MKVILLNDYPNLGKKNQEIKVKDGFAINFLIPNKIAIFASLYNQKKVMKQIAEDEKALQNEKNAIKELQEKLHDLVIEFKIKINSQTNLSYTSITHNEVKNKILKIIKDNSLFSFHKLFFKFDCKKYSEIGKYNVIIKFINNWKIVQPIEIVSFKKS